MVTVIAPKTSFVRAQIMGKQKDMTYSQITLLPCVAKSGYSDRNILVKLQINCTTWQDNFLRRHIKRD